MAREIKKLDSKTFLYNGETHAIGSQCYAIGDFVSLATNHESGFIFHNVSFKEIKVLEADGSVIVDGSASGKSAKEVVQATNNIVNFSAGGGAGALLIAKKADGKDAVFTNLAALKTYYNTHPKPDSNSAAIVGTVDSSGNVTAITTAHTWNPSTNKWQSVTTNFKGDKGDPGDESQLIDDTQSLPKKTYSSNKIETELINLIKNFGSDARLRYVPSTKRFHLEVKENNVWIDRAHIESSPIVDHLHLEKSLSTDIHDVAADELLIISKVVDNIPDHYGSSNLVQGLRPFFVLPNSIEVPLIGVYENQLRIPQDSGSNEYAAFKSELFKLIKDFGSDARVRYDNGTKHFYFEVKKTDGTWEIKAEIGASLIIDAIKYIDTPNKPSIGPKQLGQYTKIVPVPDHYGATTTHQERRPYYILPNGVEVPMTGVFEDQLRIPQADGSNEYAAFKSEIEGQSLINKINQALGNSDWQNGGGGSHPGTPFDAYSGFYYGDTIDSAAILNLKKEEITNPIHSFYAVNSNPPSYFYIAIPKTDATHVDYVAQSPSSLGTIWVKTEVVVNTIPFTVFRSPNRMYDTNPTFKLLAK